MYKFVIPQENANDDNVTITSVNVKNHQEKKEFCSSSKRETVIEVEAEKDGIVSMCRNWTNCSCWLGSRSH